jgi:hypothetical protein
LNGNCVEVAASAADVYIRDSKDRTGPVLKVKIERWREFVAGLRDGEFDISVFPS